jgi:monovalent cation:H+ antiporter-2, CPA2 family
VTARSGWEGRLLLAQTSEFSLIVALIGVQQGHVGQQLLSVIAMVTVLTMIATPWLATDRNSVRLLHRLTRRKAPAAPSPPAGHVLLLGCGEHGLALLERLQARGTRVVVVDEDAAVAARVAQMGVTALQGAAADPRVLAAAGAAQARVIVSTLRRMVDNEAVLRQAGATPVLVAVFAPEAAARVEALGGTAVAESHVAAEAFMDWFAAREGQAPGRPPA